MEKLTKSSIFKYFRFDRRQDEQKLAEKKIINLCKLIIRTSKEDFPSGEMEIKGKRFQWNHQSNRILLTLSDLSIHHLSHQRLNRVNFWLRFQVVDEGVSQERFLALTQPIRRDARHLSPRQNRVPESKKIKFNISLKWWNTCRRYYNFPSNFLITPAEHDTDDVKWLW